MPGWGTFLGTIANRFSSKEAVRRKSYAKLKKQREKLLKKDDTEANRNRIISIDKRMQSITDAAIAQ